MTTANMFDFVYLMMLLFGAQAAPARPADDEAACAALRENGGRDGHVCRDEAGYSHGTAALLCAREHSGAHSISHAVANARGLEWKAREYRRRRKRRGLGFRR